MIAIYIKRSFVQIKEMMAPDSCFLEIERKQAAQDLNELREAKRRLEDELSDLRNSSTDESSDSRRKVTVLSNHIIFSYNTFDRLFQMYLLVCFIV